jgi:hypothetical protein
MESNKPKFCVGKDKLLCLCVSHIDSRRNTNLSQTFLKKCYHEVKFLCMGLLFLTFHHSYHFVSITWNINRSITIYIIILIICKLTHWLLQYDVSCWMILCVCCVPIFKVMMRTECSVRMWTVVLFCCFIARCTFVSARTIIT